MENQFEDINLVCLCGESFVWGSGEQTFINDLLEKGKITSVQQPKRCAPCRAKNRKSRLQSENQLLGE